MWARTFERSAHEESKKVGPIHGMLILREPARTVMLIWRAPCFAKIRPKFVREKRPFRTQRENKTGKTKVEFLELVRNEKKKKITQRKGISNQ